MLTHLGTQWPHRMLLRVLPLLVVATASCATLSKDECLTADWRTFGVEDGAKGQGVARIGKYRESCAKHGVTPDLEEYRAGHEIGARSFCTPSNGYAKGRAGTGGYESFCPNDVAGPFLAAYGRGQSVYSAEQKLTRARQALAEVVDEMDTIDETIIDHTAVVVSTSTTSELRARLLVDLVGMRDRRRALATSRPERERAVSDAEAELARTLKDAGA